MIKAVIFDFGGVIKNHKNQCAQNIALAYGIPKKELLKKIEPSLAPFKKGEISEETFWKKLSSDLNEAIPKNREELWRRGFVNTFSENSSVLKLAEKLKQKGIKIAVLSNTIKPHVEIIKKKKGYKKFDVIVLSCEVGLQKPDPEIYKLTVKKLGVKPEECIFIDNKKENLKPAQEMGIKTILAKEPEKIAKQVLKQIKQ